MSMLFSQSTDSLSPFEYKHFTSIACIFAGLCCETRSNNFFTEYHKYFNKNLDHFTPTPIIGLDLKFKFFKDYKIGLSLGYVQTKMKDYFTESFVTYGTEYTREVGENLSITTYPCLLVAEYNPIEKQFQNFVGIGAGFVYSDIKWDETVTSSYEDDIRKGGSLIAEKKLYPACRIYTGIELGFDKHQGSKFLESFIIEADYTFIFRYVKMLSNVARQFEPEPSGWDGMYAIFPGYIGLSIGLSFNIERRDKR